MIWWPGDGIADDVVGDFHGTSLGGAAYASGVVGRAFSFDGVDDWVTVPFAQTANEFTVEAWVMIIGRTESGWDTIYVNDLNGGFFLLDEQIVWWQPDGDDILKVDTVIPLREWQHVAVTYDGAAFLAYLNGEIDGEGSSENSSLPMGARLGIGGHGDTDFFRGFIDELKVYDRALGAAEIKTAYLANQPGKTGP